MFQVFGKDIKKIMRDKDADFGGEHSAHFYLRENFYADSGILTLLIFLKILSEKNVKNLTIIVLSIGLFMVTSFNIINLGSNDKLEDDIDKIEDFIEDKYFLNYNYKLKIN